MFLIVYAHPNPKSFNHAIKDRVRQVLESKGHVEVRDLYELSFNPILSSRDFETLLSGGVPLDIALEQDYIKKSELLVFVYPIWWTGMPAILKGYIDRVFSYGFAYAERDGQLVGLLTDKKVIIINTLGASELDYVPSGMEECLKKTTDLGVFNFCGMQVLKHIFLYSVPTVSHEERVNMLDRVQKELEEVL
ncbi:MAG: flavodoxin family protein [Acidobacteria bacterium]|nr:MAG: flavodoxin family protein [Acidobacteriota bacterium]